MKMYKKRLSIILSLIMIITFLPLGEISHAENRTIINDINIVTDSVPTPVIGDSVAVPNITNVSASVTSDAFYVWGNWWDADEGHLGYLFEGGYIHSFKCFILCLGPWC